MGLILIDPPAVEPVALTDLKAFLQIESGFTAQDTVITSLALAARSMVEAFIERVLITQTWQLSLDYFPGSAVFAQSLGRVSEKYFTGGSSPLVGLQWGIKLPYPPLQSVASFTYTNTAGVDTPMVLNVNYNIDTLSQPGRLTPVFGQYWPVAQVIPNAVQIQYVCGYGASGANVPSQAIQAIKLLTSLLYEQRIPTDSDSMPIFIKNMLYPLKDARF